MSTTASAKRQKTGGIPDFGTSATWSFEDLDDDGVSVGYTGRNSTGTKQLSLALQTLPTPITVAFQSTKFFAPVSVENGHAHTCMFTYTTRTGYVIPFLFWYPTLKSNGKSGAMSTFSFYGYVNAKGSDSMLAHAPGTMLDCADPTMVFEQRNGRMRSTPVAEIANATVKQSEASMVLSQPVVLANYYAFFETPRFDKMLKHLRKKQDFGGRVGQNVYSNDHSRFLLAIGRDLDAEAGPERCTVVNVESKPTKKSTKTTLTLKYGTATRDIIIWPSTAVAFFGTRRLTSRDFKRDMLLFVESSTTHSDKDELYRSFDLVGVAMTDATIYQSETCAVVRSAPFLEHLGDITKRLVADESKDDSNRRPVPRCDYALMEGGGGRSVPLLAHNSVSATDEILVPCASLTKVIKRLTQTAVDNKSWPASYIPFVAALSPELVKEIIEHIDTDLTALSAACSGGEEDATTGNVDNTGAMSGDEDGDAPADSGTLSTTHATGPLRRLVDRYTSAVQSASGDGIARAVQLLGLSITLLFEFPNAADFIWCAARMGIRRRPQEDDGNDDEHSVDGGVQSGDD
jgi:hypothetical protein